MSVCDHVVVVDDDDDLRGALCQSLDLAGYRVRGFARARAALAILDTDFAGVLLTDLRMPDMDGHALFAAVSARDPDLPVVILTGHGDVPTAVDLMRRGAYDFISKPFSPDRLLPTVARALEKRALVLDNRRLRAEAREADDFGWVGASVASAAIRAALRTLAADPAPALLCGPTGSGKSHAAAILHRRSPRAAQPFSVVECATLTPTDAPAALFGHASGALSMPRVGRMRQAQRGTLILERVDTLEEGVQAQLATAIVQGAVVPVGSDVPAPIECRVVATCDDAMRLERALRACFGGAVVRLPALDVRAEDAAPLFRLFVQNVAERNGQPVPDAGPAVWAQLHAQHWPENAHDVRRFAERLALDLREPAVERATDGALKPALARFEAEQIRAALAQARGDVEAARAILRLPRKTLYDKMARHAIIAAHFRRT